MTSAASIASSAQADAPVRIDVLRTHSGHGIGRLTLDAPASLNALSLAMVDAMAPQLVAWAADPAIVAVWLDAAGDKAFCAGGDILALYRSMREAAPGAVPAEAAAFFEREYRFDYRIHTYPKPFVVWGHGIVMGGGVGMMGGASHRVVTPRTRLAMPEISIGLYPDVGGTWLLARTGPVGEFLALTGAPLNALDTIEAGLADFALRHEDKETVLQAFAAAPWSGTPATDSALASTLLAARVLPEAELPPSQLRRHCARIREVIAVHERLSDIAPRLAALANDADPWLAQAGAAFARGSPTSAALSLAMQRRLRRASLADVFRAEWHASLGCCIDGDFAEGIRALLVDKDKSPRWEPATLDALDDDGWRTRVDALLEPRTLEAHPLADLG